MPSEDCVESLKRWGKKDRLGQLLMKHTKKISAVDGKTFVLVPAEPFGLVLEALGKTGGNAPFMMSARIAATPPEAQIKEVIGSGPFKFARDHWKPGEQVEYVRNSEYLPRSEAPSGSTGGKRVFLDRIIWRYITDPWGAAEALSAGEVDWWQEPPIDFMPKLEQNPDLQSFVADPLGQQEWLRPNWLHPPFNNKKAREALLSTMDQATYLQWSLGRSNYYKACNSVYACESPYATTVGAEPIMEHDDLRASQLLKESGYDVAPVVVLQITDRPFLNAAAVVTRQRLEQVGFNVLLKAMDWSTNLVVRARKEPPDKGGWNLLYSYWDGADVIDPTVRFGLSGAGSNAWFGWPDVPQLERLASDWVHTKDFARRKQLADEIQRVALSEVTYVPWGEWLQPTVFRKSVQGVLKFGAPIFWNIKLA